jgi:ABC-2 type transport system ATP-binding protein
VASDVPAIEFRDLVKDYGSLRALEGINLRVERGQMFGFLGPNGAGKTTAIRCLLDLIRPTSGQALVLGLDCQKQSIEVRSRIGYLPGELNLYNSLTGEQTIKLFVGLRGDSTNESYVGELVERLSLDTSRSVASYSKGNRQKLGLILALMHEPEVLVLDEPTSGLDPLVQEQVSSILEDAAAAGRTVFFSSHVLPEVERMCERVAIIRRGQIVAVEDVASLKSRSLHVIEVTFESPPPKGAFALEGVREVRRDGATVHLEVRDNLDAALKAIAGHTVLDLRTEQPSLEEVFLAFYQDSRAVSEPGGVRAAS